MPWGLKRYFGNGGAHFITWSCYRRRPVLDSEAARDLLLASLEAMRERYRFAVIGYVVMPEHVHLLISEPQIADPSTVVQAVKLGFTQRWSAATGFSGQFWQRRFYDFNLWSHRKKVEKLKYMHRNPVVRGLVEKPDNWRWSSYRSYAYGEEGLVQINDWRWWEEKIRKSGVILSVAAFQAERRISITPVCRRDVSSASLRAGFLAQKAPEKWGTLIGHTTKAGTVRILISKKSKTPLLGV